MNNISNISNFIKYDNFISSTINYFKENFKKSENFTFVKPYIFYTNVTYPKITIYHEELIKHRGIFKKQYVKTYNCTSTNEYNNTINYLHSLKNYYITTVNTDLSYDVCFYLAETPTDIYYIKINEGNEYTKARWPKDLFDINTEIFSKNKRYFSQDNINNIIKKFEME
jgi:hypothetical protein